MNITNIVKFTLLLLVVAGAFAAGYFLNNGNSTTLQANYEFSGKNPVLVGKSGKPSIESSEPIDWIPKDYEIYADSGKILTSGYSELPDIYYVMRPKNRTSETLSSVYVYSQETKKVTKLFDWKSPYLYPIAFSSQPNDKRVVAFKIHSCTECGGTNLGVYPILIFDPHKEGEQRFIKTISNPIDFKFTYGKGGFSMYTYTEALIDEDPLRECMGYCYKPGAVIEESF